MNRLQTIVLFGFVCVFPTCVAQPTTLGAAADGTPSAAQQLPKIQQGITHNEAEVARLQRAVVRQELDSERASERLRLQDRQIAELRRKLGQLQAKQQAGSP